MSVVISRPIYRNKAGYLSQLVPLLEQLFDLADLDLLDGVAGEVVEGLEVDLLIRDEDVPINAVEGQHAAGEHAALLEHGLLGDAVDLAHVEGLLVELVDDHLVHALLEVVVALLLRVLVQEDHPLLQVLHVLVGRVDG